MTGLAAIHGLAQAKITPPELGNRFERLDLVRKLASLTGTSRKLWIGAPGGTGKTTLVRSFLAAESRPLLWYQVDPGDQDPANVFFYLSQAAATSRPDGPRLPPFGPEYLPNLPVFCRNFFRTFFAHFNEGSILVFDDLQEGPGESLFGPILGAAMAELPGNSSLIVISREDPYPCFARERINQTLQHLGWSDLRLSLAETRDFLAWSQNCDPPQQTVERAFALTQGWLAGLQLFLETRDDELFPQQFPSERTDLLFDYFATDIFARLPGDTQDFLLDCSFLPTISATLAKELSGFSEAEEILDRLVRGNHFTYRISTNPKGYRLHPLFRQFLLSQAKEKFDASKLKKVQTHAARLLIDSDQPEPAAELLIDAEDWTALSELIVSRSEALIRQARSQTLLQWIDALPSPNLTANPWFRYWRGCCLLSRDPAAATQELDHAFVMFEENDDTTGYMLSWAMAVFSILVSWSKCHLLDVWIDRFEQLGKRYSGFPSPQIEALVVQGIFRALSWRRPDHKDLSHWGEHLHRLVLDSPDPAFQVLAGTDLVLSFLTGGHLGKARALAEQIDDSFLSNVPPLHQLSWLAVCAILDWVVLDKSACLAKIEMGRRIIDESGIHLLDIRLFGQAVTLALSTGDIDLAKTLLAELPAAPTGDSLDQSFLYHLKADLSLQEGDIPKALSLAEAAAPTAEAAGAAMPLSFGHLGLALALIHAGQREQAVATIAKGFDVCRGMPFFTCQFHFLAAHCALDENNRDEALQHLASGLDLAAQENYVNFHPWCGDIMARLCREAIAAGIKVDYVRHLASRRDLDLYPPDKPRLTPKEVEVLEWIRRGKSNWEIAQIQSISERTVKFHVANILAKLDAKSRGQAVAIALESGLIGNS